MSSACCLIRFLQLQKLNPGKGVNALAASLAPWLATGEVLASLDRGMDSPIPINEGLLPEIPALLRHANDGSYKWGLFLTKWGLGRVHFFLAFPWMMGWD